MATATISLPDDQLAQLRLYAAMKGRRLDEVIGEAVEAYLASLPDLPTPRVTEPSNDIPDDEWQARFDAVVERIRQAGPTDLTPEEIEREITLAREEARQDVSAERNGYDPNEPYVTQPSVSVTDPEWRARFSAALAHIRSKVPPDMTPEEIEHEITLASEEARQERITRRERSRG